MSDLKILAWDDVNDRVKRTDKDPAAVSGGGENRTESDSVGSGVTSKTVVFTSPMASADYKVSSNFVNTTDAEPAFQSVIITNKTVSGFTAKWNAPTDSANYSLDYSATIAGSVSLLAGNAAISISTSSVSVVLNPPLADTDYALTAELINTTDAEPVFQQIIVTSKTTGGFTFKWNIPIDTANYSLDYQVNAFN